MQTLHLIPYPNDVTFREGVCAGSAASCVEEALPPERNGGAEAYEIEITPERITLRGGPRGLSLARRTLAKLRAQFGEQLPCLTIRDAPAIARRGLLVDSSRHFIPTEDLKALLDAMALFHLNRLHWHLTDDQGWRIEIKRHPKLTEIGARRGKSCFSMLFEPERNDGFYTQDEVRDIVAYAAARGIDIVPEIEIPGHAGAMLTACPEVACTGVPDAKIPLHGGVFPYLICAGKDASLTFLQEILSEIIALFPYPEIHIGGDEAAKRHWRACPDCQARMREKGCADENALQQWLIIEIGRFLQEQGKSAVVWNESLRGAPLPSDFIAQAWYGDEDLLRDFVTRGGRVILSPTSHCYLDYPFHVTDTEKILHWNPVPAWLQGTGCEKPHGIEAAMWTERIATRSRAGYQLFPRLAAIAEIAWRGAPSLPPAEGTSVTAADDATGKDTPAAAPPYPPDFYPRYEEGYLRELNAMGLADCPRACWKMDEAAAEEDRREYERIMNTPIRAEIEAAQEALLAEDRAAYGRA